MTDALDITASQRKIILGLLKRYLPNVTVWVYGSRIKWTSRPQSDLDMVAFASPEQKRRVSDLKEALEESDLPFRVDLFIWDEVPEQFRKNIEAEHVVLQEKTDAEVVSDWRQSTWGEELTLEYGKAIRGYKDAKGPYRVYGTNGAVGWTSKYLALGPGIILGRKGAYRGVEYSKEPFFVIDTAYYVKLKTTLYMRWLYYAVKHYKLGEIDDGSPIPSTTRAAVYVRNLLLPSIPEQKRIAAVLGVLDDKIELNRKINKTLEEMAQAIFKSWFVDFDGIPPEDLVDSELGPIPKRWKIGKLGDVISIYDSKRIPLSKKQRSERPGPFPYYGATSIMDYVDDYLFDGIYVLVGEDGSVVDEQDHPVVQYVWGKFWANNHAHVLLPQEPFGIEWLVCFLRQLNIRPFITGAVQLKLNQGNLKRIPVIIPPESVCCEFNKFADPLFSKYRANADEILNLIEVRDTLLPKLISGEVRVPEAEKMVEEV